MAKMHLDAEINFYKIYVAQRHTPELALASCIRYNPQSETFGFVSG